MLKLIMAALVIGVLWAALSGRTPELPPQLVERIETAKEVWQAVREPVYEDNGTAVESPAETEATPDRLVITKTKAVPATAAHPYQGLLEAGVVTPEFGSEARETDSFAGSNRSAAYAA